MPFTNASSTVWPALSLDEATALLTAPGAKFEMETIPIRGIPTRVWKHALPDLGALLDLSRTHAERLFATLDDQSISYEANWRVTTVLARALFQAGVRKGDRVAFAMRNLPEWPVVFFAITTIGAIAVPLNAWWTGSELAYGVRDCQAKLLIVDAERHARLAGYLDGLPGLESVIVARPAVPIANATTLEDIIGGPESWAEHPELCRPMVDLDSDDEAVIFYTSGTTGSPKGALCTHRNLTTNILSIAFPVARDFIRRGEPAPDPHPQTILTAIPLFHVTACSATLMRTMAVGHRLIFMRRWDTVQALQIIEREKVNVTGGVPTIALQLVEHPDRSKYDLSSLQAIRYGGAPSAPELPRRIHEELGALPSNGWGMTELTATVTSLSAEEYLNRPTSAGPPVAVADLQIRADDGLTVLPAGTVGELWARGPMVAKGYWRQPEATAKTFVEGWVRTGDLARLDSEGFLYIVDRIKDMVIRGGENIYSSEVESVLSEHSAVAECAIVGIPHRTLGEEPAAIVHLAPGASATEAELQDWLRVRIAAFKVPVVIHFIAEDLPRNASGKVLKKDLKELFISREPMASGLPSQPAS